MRFCLVLICLLGPLIALLALLPLAIRAQQGAVRDSAGPVRAVELAGGGGVGGGRAPGR